MKFSVFKRNVGGYERWNFVAIQESPAIKSGQKVIPAPRGYRTIEDCKADIDVLRREINESTPVINLEKE